MVEELSEGCLKLLAKVIFFHTRSCNATYLITLEPPLLKVNNAFQASPQNAYFTIRSNLTRTEKNNIFKYSNTKRVREEIGENSCRARTSHGGSGGGAVEVLSRFIRDV